jgi:hypothetical protein
MMKTFILALMLVSGNAYAMCVPQMIYDPATGQSYRGEVCTDNEYGTQLPDKDSYTFEDKQIIICEYIEVYGQWKKVCH